MVNSKKGRLYIHGRHECQYVLKIDEGALAVFSSYASSTFLVVG